jgi:CRP-like cAMP-binding protein
MDRLILRSRWLAFHLAVCHLPKVDDRLHLTFWHLADRWGRVTREGVEIQVKLSHRVLAAIVGARRPSVTTALGSLAERGLVERSSDRGWLLHGDQPAALQQMQDQLTADPSTELVGED